MLESKKKKHSGPRQHQGNPVRDQVDEKTDDRKRDVPEKEWVPFADLKVAPCARATLSRCLQVRQTLKQKSGAALGRGG